MYLENYTPDHLHQQEHTSLLQLAKALRFCESDLNENKQGRLTNSQMAGLLYRSLGPFLAMALSLAGLVGVAVGLYLFGPLIVSKVRLMLALGKYLMLGVGALFFGLIAFVIKFALTSDRIFRLLLDLAEGKVTSVTGRLTTSKSEEVEDGLAQFTRQRTETYSYVVKGEYFEVGEEAYHAMLARDGGNYRLYVTPRSRHLVALETALAETGRDPFKFVG